MIQLESQLQVACKATKLYVLKQGITTLKNKLQTARKVIKLHVVSRA